MATNVLVIDTLQPADAELGALLARCGYTVRRVGLRADGALPSLDGETPALVLIRSNDVSGADLCRAAAGSFAVPIVVLCTVDDEELVIDYLAAGADRVLCGPQSRRELEARLCAALAARREAAPRTPHLLSRRVGPLTIDARARVVTSRGEPLSLTPTEFRLLVALASRGGAIATHAELVSEVWGAGARDGLENLRLYVRYLRRKLGDAGEQPVLIVNTKGIGYRLASTAA